MEPLDPTRVIRQLHTAAGDGSLSLDEADRRIALARCAASASDLAALVADVPAPALPAPGPDAVHALPAGVEGYPHTPLGPVSDVVGQSPGRPLEIGGLLMAARKGAWVVPPYVRVKPAFFLTVLNCSDARVDSPVVHLEIVPSIGTVLLLVPNTWGVEVRGVVGNVRSRVRPDRAPGATQVVVTGDTGWLGQLSVMETGGPPTAGRVLLR